MTIIADRGLFIRIPTAFGKVGTSEAESYADALDGATREPATKADLAEVRAEVALLSQRMEALSSKIDLSGDRLLLRLGGLMLALAGVVFAALRYSTP